MCYPKTWDWLANKKMLLSSLRGLPVSNLNLWKLEITPSTEFVQTKRRFAKGLLKIRMLMLVKSKKTKSSPVYSNSQIQGRRRLTVMICPVKKNIHPPRGYLHYRSCWGRWEERKLMNNQWLFYNIFYISRHWMDKSGLIYR